ncbi:hypothetical protein BRW62_09030 [Parathermosynechococcus lividus PCC 6715]|uniref:Uncharacterized protein n=1 Tax=Parathermosynechococcus lividus PCC 6715 TaxID=1917166 RepID=A0A2D2Q2Y2_PARLV|nr:hypothetical protein [Thermostichus lividus]ATS18864.1 hypothetical protein BRW62_09030 [Thermostichus lividus PCC 6715]
MTTEHPWYAAAQLLQPALIRLLDHLRRQLETSGWQGEYETVELPTSEPQVLYWLHLRRGDRHQRVNLWELCYEICFADYTPDLEYAGIHDFQVGEVTADMGLLDAAGEVDWHQLDQKAQRVVAAMFAGLEYPLD